MVKARNVPKEHMIFVVRENGDSCFKIDTRQFIFLSANDATKFENKIGNLEAIDAEKCQLHDPIPLINNLSMPMSNT